MKAKLQIVKIKPEDSASEVNAVVVDGHVFDYLIDEDELKRAIVFCNHIPARKKLVVQDITNHFIECFSEFVGRAVTMKEFMEAVQVGELDNVNLKLEG